jgi:hypothetical protein
VDHPLPGSPEDELVALLAERPERAPRRGARDGYAPPRSEVEAVLADI